MKRNITFLLFLFTGLLFSKTGFGQEGLTYSIGFTANLSINNVNIPTNSNPISFAETQNCLSLNNGLSKFMASKKGLFSLNCLLDTSSPKALAFNLYPNPAATNYVVIKLVAFSGTAQNLLVRLVGFDGRTDISRKATLAELKNGFVVSLAGLQSGMFVVHITSDGEKLSGSQKLIIIK